MIKNKKLFQILEELYLNKFLLFSVYTQIVHHYNNRINYINLFHVIWYITVLECIKLFLLIHVYVFRIQHGFLCYFHYNL